MRAMDCCINKDMVSQDDVRSQVSNTVWEFVDSDTQYLTHNVHRYSGKFIPQIADRAIEILTRPGDLILDPYCGSGTTLLESAKLGRLAIGFDLSPLAVLISTCKTRSIPDDVLSRLRESLSQVVFSLAHSGTPDLFTAHESERLFSQALTDPRLSDEWFLKWFGTQNLTELVAIDWAIKEFDDPDARNVATLCLSNILRRVSKAATGYPNVMFDKRAGDRPRPSQLYLKELESTCEQVAGLKEIASQLPYVHAQQANATKLPLSDCSVDAIVTHPPYIGSIPYAEYGLLSLKWLGSDPKELDKQLTGGKRQSADVVSRFERDYKKMLEESHRVLKQGKYIFLMVGNPVVKGKLIDLGKMTHEFAIEVGFKHVITTTRKGMNRRANKMGDEILLFFQK